jgi:glycosyl hydrolase family 26
MRSLGVVLAAFAILVVGAGFYSVRTSPPVSRVNPFTTSRTIVTGVASSPADYAAWKKGFGGHVRIRMTFQSWSFNTAPASVLDGPGIPMISWQPWKPTALGATPTEQGAIQPGYSNAAIAAGKWDRYLRRWAKAIKAYGGPVIMRPMHEFNGRWYPWSHYPQEFVLAWRHIWNLFHRLGADNVTWVWSFQPNYPPGHALAAIARYWPGRKYVNLIGMSLLHFYGSGPIASYLRELRRAHRTYELPTILTEVNVDFGQRVSVLNQLLSDLRSMPYNEGWIWSQLPSLEQGHNHNTAFDNMNWSALNYPSVEVQLRRIAKLPF